MRPLFFLWIPKTGGTTVHNAIKGWFDNPYNGDWTDSELPDHDYYTGHVAAQRIYDLPKNAFKVTMLRNPVDRIISYYNYHHQHGHFENGGINTRMQYMDFREFLSDPEYSCQIDNYQTGLLGGSYDAAVAMLKQFDLVGVTNLNLFGIRHVVGQIGAFYGHIAPDIKPMNVSTKYVKYNLLPTFLQVELHERNQLDLKVHEAAVQMVYSRLKVRR